jgi:hypothetical protein
MIRTRQYLFLVGIIFLASCSKNQRKVNKLEGKWNVESATIQGYGQSDPDLIYEFEYCKLQHSDFCDFSVHNFQTNVVTSGVYSVDDFGTTVNMTVSPGMGFEYAEFNIVRLSNRKLVLMNENASVGQLSRIELKSIK